MGFWDTLLGGANASTNPASYSTPYAHQGQIMGQINNGLANTQGRAPDTAFRNQQLQTMGLLGGIASGQQQGAGELAAQRQSQQAIAQQQGMAQMARGGNAGMALLNAQRQTAGLGVNAAGQAQQAALQDQTNALGQLGQMTAQGRAGDLGLMGQNDQTQMAYLQQLTGMDANQLQAQIQAMQAANAKQGILGGLLSAGGQIGGAAIMHSDEALKTDIVDGRDEVDAALAALSPKSYRYKDPKHGEGRRVGVMAQDLQRSEAGARAVYRAPDGLAVDVNRALSLSLAGLARLHERVEAIDARR